MSERNPDTELDYLARAETVVINYTGASLITDEAELLRGCLYALTSIARQMYNNAAEQEAAQ